MWETFVDPQAEKYLIRLQNALEQKLVVSGPFGDLRSAPANSVSRISGSSNRLRKLKLERRGPAGLPVRLKKPRSNPSSFARVRGG